MSCSQSETVEVQTLYVKTGVLHPRQKLRLDLPFIYHILSDLFESLIHHQRYPFRLLLSAQLKLDLNCTSSPTRLSSSAVAEGVGKVAGSSSFALSVTSSVLPASWK